MGHRLLICLVFVSIFCSANAQGPSAENISSNSTVENNNSNAKWSKTAETTRKFIENKGQFDGRTGRKGGKVLYAIEQGASQIYFTKEGVTYRFDKRIPNKEYEEWEEKHEHQEAKERKEYEKHKDKMSAREREREEREHEREEKEEAEKERSFSKYNMQSHFVQVTWQGANPQVAITAEGSASDYSTYAMLHKDKSMYTVSGVHGYDKLVYKNLYPGIDAEYTFHPEEGIKYSLIVHPGADPSKVQMNYPKNAQVTIGADGSLHIATPFGDIIEHAPLTYYEDNTSDIISSRFTRVGNTFSFGLASFNANKTVVIDPWVVSPNLSLSRCVWEVDKDAAGNVYALAGDLPMRLQKYNSTGVLQWTYNTPYDTSDWLGSMATDANGNTYITRGSAVGLQKVDNSGALLWNNNGAAFNSDEYWSIAFNCDETKLIVGGTRLGSGGFGYIFDINTSNGNILNTAKVGTTHPSLGFGGIQVNDANEVRSIAASRNSKYYYLTLDSIGAISQDFALCNAPTALPKVLFNRLTGYNFSYKSEDYRPSNMNSGICAIVANDKFVYTQNGVKVDKRSLSDGAIITSATIPGGINTTTFGLSQPGNNGIDVDDCGNVYVGSGDRVIKYDANLNLLSSATLPFKVYDLVVSTNGDVIVCGGTGNSDNTVRSGFLQSISSFGACAPFALICCNPTICPKGPLCSTDVPVTLTAATGGGVWSGPGINASTGVFSPSVAGVGTHTIVYTLACGADSIRIKVNNCAALVVCIENNGQYTVTGGNGAPYTWQSGVPFTNCTGCTFGICFPGICNGFADTTWTTFATTPTATTPGTFPIRVKDGGVNVLTLRSAAGLLQCNPCPDITTFVVAQTATSCPGVNDGSATLGATAGAAPYTYTWQPGGGTGATRTGLAAGTYTVYVLDANSCRDTATVTIAAGTGLTVSATTSNSTCGANNGTATANVTAGIGPYSYAWSNSGNTQTISNLAAGTYSVTVTGTGGCTATASGTVTASNAIAANVTVTAATCGAINGTATANVTVGTGPYTYAWSNSGNTQTISNLAAGTYTVTVTGAGGCTATANGTLTATNAIAANVTVIAATCGANNGTATANVTAGTGPYSYAWSNSGNTQTISNLAAGTYTVAVTGAGGCTATANGTVTATNAIAANVTVTAATCGANSGTATANVTAGTGPYTYAWSNTGNTQTISNLAAGTYTVTVTGTGGCTATASGTVTAVAAFFVDVTTTPTTCGAINGSAIASMIAGNPPFTYAWSNSGNTRVINGLANGSYTVTVTDGGGCTATATGTVGASAALTINVTVTATNCGTNSGTATANILTGTGPFTYVWSNGGSTQTITGLAPGIYYVTVSDGGGCTAIDNGRVPGSLALAANVVVTAATCGNNNGTASANITAGTGPFSYAWSNTGNTQTINSLAAGIYTVTITGAGGCTGTVSGTVASNGQVVVNLTNQVDPTCAGNDGRLTISLTGGTAPYTVTIDTGGTPVVINSPATFNQTFTTLSPGSVNVSVSDANGCQGNASATLAIPVCCTFSVSATLVQPSCGQNNGSIVITPSNGSGSYSYTWAGGSGSGTTGSNLGAGNYAVTISDNAFIGCLIDTVFSLNSNSTLSITFTNITVPGCKLNDGQLDVNWNGGTAPYTITIDTGAAPIVINSVSSSFETLFSLYPSTVNVSVLDAAGCQANASTILPYPDCCHFTVQNRITKATCGLPNGMIEVLALGGTAHYSYNWANGLGTNDTLFNVPIGTYQVTIIDSGYLNCFLDTVYTVTGSSALLVSLNNVSNPTCAGRDGRMDIAVANGTPPYVITIDTGGSLITINAATAYNQAFIGLPAGTVIVSVVDSSGCRDTATTTLINPNCCTVTLSAILTQPTCGQNNGSIVVTAANGSGNYSYTWAAGVGSGNTATNLSAGTYALTITDNAHAGCQIDTLFTLNSNSSLVVSSTEVNDVDCYGKSTGRIIVSITGGTSPYSYTWSNGQNTDTAKNLIAGSYTVTVTDVNNCITTYTDSILQSPELQLQFATTPASCTAPDSGSATAQLAGGTAPYSYVWSTGETTSTITGILAGQYGLSITDALGCTTTGSTIVTGDSIPVISFGPDKAICIGDSTVLTSAYANTVWSDGHSGFTYTANAADTVWATITNGNCTASDTVHIFVIDSPSVPILNVSDTIICTGDRLVLSVQDFHYNYVWSTGDTGLTTTVSLAGNYMVSASNGCGVAFAQATITTDDTCFCQIFIPNIFSPNGDGNNDFFEAYTQCENVQNYAMTIYNRWGDVVFKTTDRTKKWDGTFNGQMCSSGAYVYYISYETWFHGGFKDYSEKGSITIVR